MLAFWCLCGWCGLKQTTIHILLHRDSCSVLFECVSNALMQRFYRFRGRRWKPALYNRSLFLIVSFLLLFTSGCMLPSTILASLKMCCQRSLLSNFKFFKYLTTDLHCVGCALTVIFVCGSLLGLLEKYIASIFVVICLQFPLMKPL